MNLPNALLECGAVGPGLQGAVVDWLHGLNYDPPDQSAHVAQKLATENLTWNVLVATEGRSDRGLIGQGHPVLLVWREQALEHCSSRVEDRGSLTANLDADMDFLKVDEVGRDTANVRGRRGVQVGFAEERTELVRLNL